MFKKQNPLKLWMGKSNALATTSESSEISERLDEKSNTGKFRKKLGSILSTGQSSQDAANAKRRDHDANSHRFSFKTTKRDSSIPGMLPQSSESQVGLDEGLLDPKSAILDGTADGSRSFNPNIDDPKLSTLAVNDKNRKDTIYQPLDPSRREIRRLRLLPDDNKQAMIRCHLETVSLDDDPLYVALSYMWGDNKDLVEIEVNGVKTLIRRNLAAALGQFRIMEAIPWMVNRAFTLDMPLWVDALCINQADDNERNSQVRMMSEIFSRNWTVAWLGLDPIEHLDLAMLTLSIMFDECPGDEGKLPAVEWIKKYPVLYERDRGSLFWNNAWTAVRHLFDLPYWRRVWIAQEVALAESLVFMAGEKIIEQFSVKLIHFFVRDVRDNAIEKPSWIPTELWSIWKNDLLQVDLTILIVGDQLKDVKESLKYHTIGRTINHQATDPKDKIFAFQALVGNVVLVDYRMNVEEIYFNFVKDWAAASDYADKLHFLRMAGVGLGLENQYKLPSWVPDWQALSLAGHALEPYTQWDDWNAAACLGFLVEQDSESRIRGDVLQVTGYRCDVIQEVLPRRSEGSETVLNLARICLMLKDMKSHDGSYLLRRFLRLTIWDRSAACKLAELPGSFGVLTLYMQLLMLMMRSGISGSAVVTFFEDLGLARNGECTPLFYECFDGLPRDKPWVSADYSRLCLERFLDTGDFTYNTIPSNMRVFITNEGYLGSGPCYVKPGDIVCIVVGSNIPIVLREGKSHFIHVGPCFVPGVMEGEIAKRAWVGQGELQVEEFIIL